MLTFLRKTRQKLIITGSVRKYLIYAIGEIALVVVGILIALQINNWNTQRNDNELEQQYISRLLNELNEEVQNFEKLKTGFKRQQEAVMNLVEIWNQKRIFIKDTTQFWQDIFIGSGPGPWYNEPIIWTQLVQSGELKLLKDQKSIEALLKHYSEVKSIAENFNQYPTQTTNEARKLIATTFAESDFLLLESSNRPRKPTPKTIDTIIKKRQEYKALFVRVGIIARIHVGSMERMEKSARNVIDLLQKNIES